MEGVRWVSVHEIYPPGCHRNATSSEKPSIATLAQEEVALPLVPILGTLPTLSILGTGEMIPQNDAPKPCAIFLKLIFPTHFSKNKKKKKNPQNIKPLL